MTIQVPAVVYKANGGRKACGRHFSDVLNHREFAVKNDTEVPNGVDRIRDDRAESEIRVELSMLGEVGSETEPYQLRFVWVEL